jgi:hypothetical protein
MSIEGFDAACGHVEVQSCANQARTNPKRQGSLSSTPCENVGFLQSYHIDIDNMFDVAFLLVSNV